MSPAAALQEKYNYGISQEQEHLRTSFTSPILDHVNTATTPLTICPEQSSSSSSITKLFKASKATATTSEKIDSEAIKNLAKRVFSFSELKENWDGYNGSAPAPSAITDALKLIKMFPESELPERAGISSDGEISLFWEKKDLYADFGVEGNGTFTYFIKRYNKKYYGDDLNLSDGLPEEAISALKK